MQRRPVYDPAQRVKYKMQCYITSIGFLRCYQKNLTENALVSSVGFPFLPSERAFHLSCLIREGYVSSFFLLHKFSITVEPLAFTSGNKAPMLR